MTEAEKNIYIKIRAEVIKHFNDTRNAGKFKDGGFSMQHSLMLASKELDADLKSGYTRITIDELLLYSLEDCFLLIQSRNQQAINILLSINEDNY